MPACVWCQEYRKMKCQSETNVRQQLENNYILIKQLATLIFDHYTIILLLK